MDRVRVNTRYKFNPVWFDKANPPFDVEPGEIVKVINLHGCPPANTMRMCHVAAFREGAWKFAGHVCTASLDPL